MSRVGGLATRPQLAAEFVRMGARYVSTGTDLGFLLAACAAKAKEVRGSFGRQELSGILRNWLHKTIIREVTMLELRPGCACWTRTCRH